MTPTLLTASHDRAQAVRDALLAYLTSNLQAHGDNLAGFAVVTWDMRGATQATMHSGHGMVSQDLAPTLVHDVLVRLLAVQKGQRTEP